MSRILAIDPGPIESGWVAIDVDTRRPLAFEKTLNTELRRSIRADIWQAYALAVYAADNLDPAKEGSG